MTSTQWDKQYDEWRSDMINGSAEDLFESAPLISAIQSVHEWLSGWFEWAWKAEVDELVDLDLFDFAGEVHRVMQEDNLGYLGAISQIIRTNGIDIMKGDRKWRSGGCAPNEQEV